MGEEELIASKERKLPTYAHYMTMVKEVSGRIVLGDVRLGALFGHRDTWVRRLEKNGIIERINDRQQRGLYDLEKALPRIVEYLLELNRKRYQDVKIVETKQKIRRLRMENAVRAGSLISKEQAFAQWAPTFIGLRRCFEALLMMGTPQDVIDEMLEIIEHGPNGTNGVASAASAVGATAEVAGSDRLD